MAGSEARYTPDRELGLNFQSPIQLLQNDFHSEYLPSFAPFLILFPSTDTIIVLKRQRDGKLSRVNPYPTLALKENHLEFNCKHIRPSLYSSVHQMC